jgi:hypothetical protein
VMSDDDRPRLTLRIVRSSRPPVVEPDKAHLTIADVANACGLPQPVVAQLAPRTWTAEGWMYTDAQLQSAIEIASAWRARGAAGRKRVTPIIPTESCDDDH